MDAAVIKSKCQPLCDCAGVLEREYIYLYIYLCMYIRITDYRPIAVEKWHR